MKWVGIFVEDVPNVSVVTLAVVVQNVLVIVIVSNFAVAILLLRPIVRRILTISIVYYIHLLIVAFQDSTILRNILVACTGTRYACFHFPSSSLAITHPSLLDFVLVLVRLAIVYVLLIVVVVAVVHMDFVVYLNFQRNE